MPRRTSCSSSRLSRQLARRGLRGCGIESVVLVDAQIDHTTGLYMLREKAARGPSGAPTRCMKT
jgi:phosphoribosyl 1,2-cyclic phosphodiesterase